VESFLFLSGEQRYLNLTEASPHVHARVPLYQIASYLGLERESLSRLRRKIHGAGSGKGTRTAGKKARSVT
jgi:CRP/FNR family transcriptional regulator, anaerobic regulatory protein